jgi:hypothetical protein
LRYKENFAVLFTAVNVAVSKNIKPATAKLLLFLVSVMDYQNTLDYSVAELANELTYTTRMILKSLKELEEYKIILRIQNPKDKRRNIIVINPLQSWKGKVSERNLFIKSLTVEDKNQLKIPFPELALNESNGNLSKVFSQKEAIDNFEKEKE